MQKYLDILGKKVRDRVTLAEGVVTSVSYDLYGCVQVVVDRGFSKEKPDERLTMWADFKRLEVLEAKPVMEQPVFGDPGVEAGPADKPRMMY